MQFVQGLPQGVYVGQTRVHHEQVQPSAQPELAGFNLALHVRTIRCECRSTASSC